MLINRRSILLFTLLLLALPGCSWWDAITNPARQPQSFADYAEAVFRRQNKATSQMMIMSLDEAEDPEAFEELLNAEKNMRQACADLNAYADQSQNQTSTSLLLRARAGKSINACDLATSVLENLLSDHDLAVISPKPSAK